ncbi:MAG: hypothetical protein CBC47_00585 [Alphaproteobacteria bacterium TMED87]|nr:glucose-methanol-choline oxidoreductase [Rhodospirillaceae bacterium]OUV11980.1 MAG: hypothetical protein CBC47_00585 [Alphaproteobacteria bacterium TMED87]
MNEYDYIIIGAGSSGSSLSSRLAEYNPNSSILLLEAGGADISPFIHVPAAIIKAIGNPKLDWMYLSDPDKTRNNKKDLWPAGKVLGGSSSINGMLYVRGNKSDYEQWSKNGCKGWDYKSLLPIFKRIEKTNIGDQSFRGRNGPIHVNWLRSTHPLSHIFVKAAQENGLQFNSDYNGIRQSGVSYSQVTQKRGWRYHTARAYLWPGKKLSNIHIRTRAFVKKLLFKDHKCLGVNYTYKNKEIFSKAKKEVIVCAGSLGSPKILMQSGLGPEKHLSDLGIPVIANIDAIGKNLQDHPEVMLSIEVNQPTYNTEINSWKIILHSLNWFLFGRGPATSPYPHAIAFLNHISEDKNPNVQVQLGPYAFSFDENGVIPHHKPAISAAVNLSYPKSRGKVLLRSNNPKEPPAIKHEMFSNIDDLNQLINACKKVRTIFDDPHFDDYRIAERLPGKDIQTDEEWSDYIRQTAFLGYHPVGTCRMGTDAASVVGPDLRVNGIEGLRIADASIIPTLISGNTNAISILIGEKAADIISFK